MQDSSERVYTPSELNQEVRLHIEMGFPRLLVEGEISNLSRPASGHLYFSLKDDRAQLRCALFRSAAARSGLRLENGMKVLARGRLGLYEPRGEFQMIVDRVRDAGEGALQRQFEQLKAKLEAEGLFAAERKRPLPPYPARIAIVTSPQGAALSDMLQILERRWPLARVRLHPVLVQGAAAPPQIRAAIDRASRDGWADLLLIGRGGGSLEDLAAFNDEGVARAVARCSMPVVSAVGHETDFSIADFVADLRAPTPSAAAELATPDQALLSERFRRLGRQLLARWQEGYRRGAQRVDHAAHRLQQQHPARRLAERARQLEVAQRRLDRAQRQSTQARSVRLQAASRRLAAARPDRRLAQQAERLRHARQSLQRSLNAALRSRNQRLAELARTLQAVSPLQVLGRGYAVLTQRETGKLVSRVSEAGVGEHLVAEVRDGRFECRIERVRPESD